MNTTEKLIAAARKILSELDELGFDEDESIDGGDCVDVVASLVPELREALAAYDTQQPCAWQPPSGDAPIRSIHFAQHDVPSLSDHTPEPWEWEGEIERITGPDGATIADVTTVGNARRIVACVNACDGIPTASLEAGIINLGMDTINALAQMHQKG